MELKKKTPEEISRELTEAMEKSIKEKEAKLKEVDRIPPNPYNH